MILRKCDICKKEDDNFHSFCKKTFHHQVYVFVFQLDQFKKLIKIEFLKMIKRRHKK